MRATSYCLRRHSTCSSTWTLRRKCAIHFFPGSPLHSIASCKGLASSPHLLPFLFFLPLFLFFLHFLLSTTSTSSSTSSPISSSSSFSSPSTFSSISFSYSSQKTPTDFK